MSGEDKKIKAILQKEVVEMSADSAKKIENLLENLPEKEIQMNCSMKNCWHWRIVLALCVVVFLLPNLDSSIAYAMYDIPLIGHFFEVITIRKYEYHDSYHEAEISIPEIVESDEHSEGMKEINEDSKILITKIIDRFEETITEDNYIATYVDYEVVTDSEDWFTLKLSVSEVAGSSDQYFKFYHIDKQSGKAVELCDLFQDKAYIDAISENIRIQMVKQMEESEDDTVVYWTETICEDENLFYEIEPNQNFYFNTQNELVIVFDKYVVGPGSMGCPEFIIPYEIYGEYLKEADF